MGRFKDLTGKKFNKLTVISMVEPPKTRKNKDIKYWSCKCDCGNDRDIVATTNDIISGHVKSCGCIRKGIGIIDITGQAFGRLTAIKQVGQPKHLKPKRDIYWLCKCSCGSNKDVIKTGYDLRSGNTKSCGCLNRELAKTRSKKYNTYDLSGNYGIGYTSKNEEFYFDLEDYDLIKDYYWYVNDNGYAITPKDANTNKRIRMHRLIMDAPDGVQVDHIKHNKLDNRKKYLRLVTSQQNQMNRRNVKGVYWNKDCNKWNSKIGYNGKSIDLGLYENKDDAIKARKEAEEHYFGKYSYDNSINKII